MPTECSPALFEFAPVEGRRVVARFDGGAITSDAGALLLGQTDDAIRLTERLAACFTDRRTPGLVEHQVETLVMQRVFGVALGYEDLNDHDELRRDPVLAALAGKLRAQRPGCEPLAGRSTLNRLELSRAEATRYHKISHDAAAIERLFVDVFLDAEKRPPKQIILDLDATDDPLHGNHGSPSRLRDGSPRRAGSSTATHLEFGHSGSMAEGIGDAFTESWTEFCCLGRMPRDDQTLCGPDLAPHGGEGIDECRLLLVIPSAH